MFFMCFQWRHLPERLAFECIKTSTGEYFEFTVSVEVLKEKSII